MISRQSVAATLKALLETVDADAPVGLVTAPRPVDGQMPARYLVVELPEAPITDGGDLEDPERHLTLRFRVRTVVSTDDVEVSTNAALHLADAAAVKVLDRTATTAGDGWIVRGRSLVSSSGVMAEGPLVNNVDEFEWWVVPGPAAD